MAKDCTLSEHHKQNIKNGMFNHWEGKRTGTINKAGYVSLTIENRRVYKHRLVMEQHLGRELTKDEVVHHIDEDKLNNHIDNLEILTSKEHSRLHAMKRGFGKLVGVSPVNKTPLETINNIKKDRLNGFKIMELVDKYKISYPTIQKYAKEAL